MSFGSLTLIKSLYFNENAKTNPHNTTMLFQKKKKKNVKISQQEAQGF